jgi:hypothetical protein
MSCTASGEAESSEVRRSGTFGADIDPCMSENDPRSGGMDAGPALSTGADGLDAYGGDNTFASSLNGNDFCCAAGSVSLRSPGLDGLSGSHGAIAPRASDGLFVALDQNIGVRPEITLGTPGGMIRAGAFGHPDGFILVSPEGAGCVAAVADGQGDDTFPGVAGNPSPHAPARRDA